MNQVFRIYSEKRPPFAVAAQSLAQDLRRILDVDTVDRVRILYRYDVSNLTPAQFEAAIPVIFSEPQVDVVCRDLPAADGATVFAVEYLPGQYDQRADSCAQCLQMLGGGDRPIVRTAQVYYLYGSVTADQLARIKGYIINPVESREATLGAYQTLETKYEIPTSVDTVTGFTSLDECGLRALLDRLGLAMDLDDLTFLQAYFRDNERRDPTITEVRMIDTYWSDHCRHTTFSTVIEQVEIAPEYIRKTYAAYLDARRKLGRENKPLCLMDVATIGQRILKAEGVLKDLDESEEINACSVRMPVEIDGRTEEYLLMFKNETHNHPTEIEPFGGAATCLGGAIRDPLSGRSYVYQAMRVTGSADPRTPMRDTIPGKLPQRAITTRAAHGYSSYGNQIGLATGFVEEVYHPGYVAKRLEIGAVVGAAPSGQVVRKRPEPGDVVVLLGGRTGRDGCGGATGSSKSHTLDSLQACGAEVQKGNPPEERKLQRLFRNPDVSRLIKRCNDFGAGGVSVAIGELADGLEINLDAVPKKYDGLDGTELAISESQERMAVVLAPSDVQAFQAYASAENIEATVVAVVTGDNRLKMRWNGNTIVDISREFLNTNGAVKYTDVTVPDVDRAALKQTAAPVHENFEQTMAGLVRDLNVCSQKGLVERFDSSIGAGTVLMPFGGKYQLTPIQAMASAIPVLKGDSATASLMAYGFNPYVSSVSPYHGAAYAVVESVAKLVAAGGDPEKIYLTLQEYFPRTKGDPRRWGLPFSALLGALSAQINLGYAAIGGKDSMSGTFEDIDVPPTLVSFAVSYTNIANIISPEFKRTDSELYWLPCPYDQDGLPDYSVLRGNLRAVAGAIRSGGILSCYALSKGGLAEALFKMSAGNKIGVEVNQNIPLERLLAQNYGGFLLETQPGFALGEHIGRTIAEPELRHGSQAVSLDMLIAAWTETLEPIFPVQAGKGSETAVPVVSSDKISTCKPGIKAASPRVLIPVFPGTNTEYDTARKFEDAGAVVETLVVRNLTAADIEDSIRAAQQAIDRANIVMLPGGFSCGDEPEGSGKFIAAFLRNPRLADAVERLLYQRDGLMLGICNGFQALIKLGLVPYGHILDMTADMPTLTFNTIGRHQSMMVDTRISSVQSPWLADSAVGEIYTVPISHGEGRFVASDAVVEQLIQNGQIATQYVDKTGRPTMEMPYNPNGSVCAVEGILSPDGRVFGKMAHNERIRKGVAINIAGRTDHDIFRAGVRYFK